MTAVLTLLFANCIDCPHHKVEQDPDPDDWFNDDDVKVVCTKANKNITSACRPYKTREESEVPSWCPLKKEADVQAKKEARRVSKQ